jgi:polyphosphate kinase
MHSHPIVDLNRTGRVQNRELSWLQFNRRVLEMASDTSLPLLDRVRFASIFSSNLDEFFQVRVAALMNVVDSSDAQRYFGGLSAEAALRKILIEAERLSIRHENLFVDDLRPALAEAGIALVRWNDCSPDEWVVASALYERLVHPAMTPLAVDPSHPFPYISNLSVSLAVILDAVEGPKFARVKIPPFVPRFVTIGEGRFLLREDLVAAHLDRLFPGVPVVSLAGFRVTRSTDLSDQQDADDDADDLLESIEMELRQRRRGRAVRLETGEGLAATSTALLLDELDLSPAHLVQRTAPLDLSALSMIADLDRPDLKSRPRSVHAFRWPTTGRSASTFETLKRSPMLVQHPYESFASTVEEFLRLAATDPDVVAIKMTLYRTSAQSAIIAYLTEAVERGAEVVVVVELRARFDEQANVQWARRLGQAGVHVTYGIAGLKTHAKCILVVRREGDRLRRYAHIGTGNYNPSTSRIYEDFSLFTADEHVVADVGHLFNYLTGYGHDTKYDRLVVSPHGIRACLIEQVEREMAYGSAGHIVWKVNALVDPQLIEALYRASSAGVRVDIIVRSACCLRAQVPGMSENVHVRSVLGRYLEHSRVYFAAHGSGPSRASYLIGSADAMQRNLDDRVEVLVPLEGADHRRRVQAALDALLADDRHAWVLCSNGRWEAVGRPDGTSAQDVLTPT